MVRLSHHGPDFRYFNLHEDILVIDREYCITDINNTALLTLGLKHADIMMSPMKNEDGQATTVIEAARDITDLIQVREALLQSEEKFRAIFEHMAPGCSLDEIIGSGRSAYRLYFPAAHRCGHAGDERRRIGQTVEPVMPKYQDVVYVRLYGQWE